MLFDDHFFIAMRIIFILFTTITLLFALTILLTISIFWKTKYRSVPNLFISNSAIALLFYIVAIALEIPNLFADGDALLENAYCKFRAFFLCFACSVKSLSYLIQAISRWFIITYSRHPLLRTYRTHFLMILSTWLISFLVCGVLIFCPQAYQYERESQLCILTTKHFLTSFIPYVILFFIPLLIILLLYGHILWRTTLLQNQAKEYIQIYQTLLTLIAIVIIGGVPYFLSAVLNLSGRGPWWLYSVSLAFISFEAMLESMVLFFNHSSVKEQCHEWICCQCRSPSNEVLPA